MVMADQSVMATTVPHAEGLC
ncbi:hypothetical protein MTBSS4_10305 [Magnetospirillum sp. SS-4]|nr:hypothetical protein MTBSS4_10305 [Magnetospirillum sp. SS-4]